MEAISAWIVANWIVPAATAGLAALAGIGLKIAAKGLKWVTDDKVLTMIKGWLTQTYQTRASDQLPPMAERGETPEGSV